MDSNTRRSRNCVRMTTRLGVMYEKEHDFANASSRARTNVRTKMEVSKRVRINPSLSISSADHLEPSDLR